MAKRKNKYSHKYDMDELKIMAIEMINRREIGRASCRERV